MDQKINPTASSARESARHGDGKFGEQAHSNPGQLSGLTGTRYADMEPHDIDMQLDRLEWALAGAQSELTGHVRWLRSKQYMDLGATPDEVLAKAESGPPEFVDAAAFQSHVDGAWQAAAKSDELREQIREVDAEFEGRGGWNRPMLVPGGHLHADARCSTCHRESKRTNMQRFSPLSGKSEDDIVEAAGYRACTTCFSSAPLGMTEASNPTGVFSREEQDKQAAKAEREAKAAERAKAAADKAITSPDGSPLRDDEGRTIETEHAARLNVVDALADAHFDELFDESDIKPEYRNSNNQHHLDYVARKAEHAKAIVAAIAAKHGVTADEVHAELDAKALAKAKKYVREAEKNKARNKVMRPDLYL